VRAVTALGLATVSLGLVFAAGRMSTWIVPIADIPAERQDRQERVKGPDVPAAKTALAVKPRAAPSSPNVTEAAIGGAKTSTDPTPPSRETSGAVALRVAERVLRGMEEAARQTPSALHRTVVSPEPTAPKAPVVLNAGANGFRAADSGRPAAAGGQEPDKTADDTVGQCERRYSSFRPSDGTYQPFDGGPRKRCPLLR
jgi:hypothetical protein